MAAWTVVLHLTVPSRTHLMPLSGESRCFSASLWSCGVDILSRWMTHVGSSRNCCVMRWRGSELETDGHMDLGSVIFTFRCAHVHLSCSLNDSELDQNFSFSQIIKKLGESWLHHKIFRTMQSCVNYNNWAVRKPEDQVKWNTHRWGCSWSTFHVVVNLNNWNSWGLMFCVV